MVTGCGCKVAGRGYKVMLLYRVFSHDVTEVILVSLNKGIVAMLVSQTNPPGIELYSYANVFFCFLLKHMLIDQVSGNAL